MNTKDFENRVMGRIEGQTPLPQGMFRQFLEWLNANQPESVDISGKQDKSDNTLTTSSKTIVGAINELKAAIDALQPES